MRTTVSIDDDVLRAAKQRAAAENRSLSDFVTEALRTRLAPRGGQPRRPFRILTDGEGGPRPGVDINNNAAVRDLMDEE